MRVTAPIATFKDLSIDAVDPLLLGPFWAAALGLELARRDDDMVQLTGPTPQSTVWLAQVPEPVTVKQRVHLDVHVADVDDLLALGATPLDLDSFRWQVLRDPEGGELCAFPRDEVPARRLYEVVVDAHDREPPWRAWWAEVLGGRLGGRRGARLGRRSRRSRARRSSSSSSSRSRSRRRSRTGSTGTSTSPTSTCSRRTAPPSCAPATSEIGWTVLADPEGNEFCAFVD